MRSCSSQQHLFPQKICPDTVTMFTFQLLSRSLHQLVGGCNFLSAGLYMVDGKFSESTEPQWKPDCISVASLIQQGSSSYGLVPVSFAKRGGLCSWSPMHFFGNYFPMSQWSSGHISGPDAKNPLKPGHFLLLIP